MPVSPVKPLILSRKSDRSAKVAPSIVPKLTVELTTLAVVFIPVNLKVIMVEDEVLESGVTVSLTFVSAYAVTPVVPLCAVIASPISLEVAPVA